MADEDISKPAEISLEPEQKELDLGQPKEPESKPEPKPKEKVEGSEVLRAQLEEQQRRNELERNARMEAERVAQQRAQEIAQIQQRAVETQTNLVDSQYQTVVNTLDAYTRENEIARRDFAQAASTQDWQALAEAQSRMSRADAMIVQLETAKANFEEQARQYQQQQQQPPQPQQRQYTPDERFNQYLSQFSPRAQQYLRQHPEYATDERLNRRLIRMHGEAVDEQGLAADSEDYYRFLDQRMGEVQQPEQRTRNVPQRQQQQYAPAPVSRGPVNGARSANSVTLTPAEREAARISGVSEVDYAKQMLELEAAGQIVRH